MVLLGVMSDHAQGDRTWLFNESEGGCAEMTSKNGVGLGGCERAIHVSRGTFGGQEVVHVLRIYFC